VIGFEHLIAGIVGAVAASYLIGRHIDTRVKRALMDHMLTTTWEFLTEEGKRYKVTTEPPEIE
jgi:hypothetical protein